MGNDFAVALTGEIVIVDDRRFDRVGDAIAMEIAEHFLLFRVDADHGAAGVESLLLQFSDVFKLSVAVGVLSRVPVACWKSDAAKGWSI